MTGFPGFSGKIDGDGGLVKTGAGIQSLSGDLTVGGDNTSTRRVQAHPT